MKRSLLLSVLFACSTTLFAQTVPRISNVAPAFGPTSGGSLVVISGENLQREVECFLPCPVTVSFGSIEVPARDAFGTYVAAVAPAHGVGTVDLTVNIPGKGPVAVPTGFTFQATAVDSYQRVLLPIYLDKPARGAFGAEWKTDLWMRNNSRDAVALAAWPCASDVCTEAYPQQFQFAGLQSLHNLPALENGDGNPSRMLYVTKEKAANLSYSLRFADVSRSTIDAGVGMPVIRETELLDRDAQLFDVPLKAGFRVMLRIYDVTYTSSKFRVTIYPQRELEDQGGTYFFEIPASSTDTGEFRSRAAYAQYDITSLLSQQRVWPENARIEVTPLTPGSRFWAFASITNNDTQVVTLVSPQ